MSSWYRRMIFYEPEHEAVRLDQGTMHYQGNGVMRIEYGDIRLLATTSLHCGNPQDRSRTARLNAVVLPALDPLDPSTHGGALRGDIPVIAPPGCVDAVEALGFGNIHYLHAWRQVVLRRGEASITITALPTALPTETDEVSMQVMDSMVEFRPGAEAVPYRAFLCGGASHPDTLDEIARRYPRIDLAVINLPATRVGDTVVSFDTAHAADIVRRISPATTIPVHSLDTVFDWPLRDFKQALCRAGETSDVRSMTPGTLFAFPVSSSTGGNSPAVVLGQDRFGSGSAAVAGD